MVTNVFTALQLYSGGIAMRHSSVRLSVKRVHCDKTKYGMFLNCTKERLSQFSDTKNGW